MPSTPPSLLGRAIVAISLTVGFYVLALGIAVAFIVGPGLLWATSGTGNLWAAIALFFAGVAILRAIVPVRDTFVAPGPKLNPMDQPELHTELRAVAAAVGSTVPPDVYLASHVNASVAEISNGLLRGRRRIMILGLPLLSALTPAQMRAVVAHEYGHYVGGDTRFSAWIWRTRVAVLTTVHALDAEDSWFQRVIVRTPFLLYAKLFLRLTNAISRRAEFAADAVAAQAVGKQEQAAALRAVAAAAPAYDAYWHEDVAFALSRGRHPPIAAGFQRFLADHEVRAQVDEIVAADIEQSETDPYDSHPTLADRLRALGAQPTGEISPPQATDSATALLRDLETLEHALLSSAFGDEAVADLRTIGWEECGELFAADGAQIAELHQLSFAGLTVADAAQSMGNAHIHFGSLRATLDDHDGEIPDDELEDFWRYALGRLVLAALHRDGWLVETAPGEPLVCRRGEDLVEPYRELAQAAESAPATAAWRARCEALGIAQLALAPEAMPASIAPAGDAQP